MNVEVLDELTRAKTRLTNAKAELAEIKLQVQRGELISIEDVQSQWSENASNARKKILSLETKLPPKLYGKTLGEMSAAIRAEVYEVLNELGDYQGGK